MSYRPRFDSGDWKVICDVCGREFKASRLKKRWDGFMVCPDDWEPRQPQDFVHGISDVQAPPWTRPETSDTFIGGGCSTNTSIAGLAIAGCMIAGNIVNPGSVPSGTFTV